MNKFESRGHSQESEKNQCDFHFFFAGDCLTCRRTSVNYWAEAPAL